MMAASLPNPTPPTPGVRDSVLSIPAFRKLWRAMAFSSFGDWLGLLATTALAQQLSNGDYANESEGLSKKPSRLKSKSKSKKTAPTLTEKTIIGAGAKRKAKKAASGKPKKGEKP